MPTDAELLQRYARQQDEGAFAELVRRHLGLVYATALRSTAGRAHLAEDVAQKVFGDLARKADRLAVHPVLTGWLYRSARYAAMEINRSEARRRHHHEAYAATADNQAPGAPADWEQLMPVLDEAMEALKEGDRQLMLLRFFQGLTFSEIGDRLQLSENAARMRSERAMQRLRDQLGRRGITSTAVALGLLLANRAVAAPPAGLAVSVTTAALAVAPAGSGLTGWLPGSKVGMGLLSAAATAGLTAIVWQGAGLGGPGEELAVLREENDRLREEVAASASLVAANTGAPEAAAQSVTLVEAITQRLEARRGAGPSRHRDHGQATPYEAFLSFAWALDTGNATALARLLTYDEAGREAIRSIHAGLPEAMRAQYPSPQEFVVMLYIADTLLYPVWDADVAALYTATEISPGVAAVRRPGSGRGGMKWVQTAEGWKTEVPAKYPEHLVNRVLGNAVLARLGRTESP